MSGERTATTATATPIDADDDDFTVIETEDHLSIEECANLCGVVRSAFDELLHPAD